MGAKARGEGTGKARRMGSAGLAEMEEPIDGGNCGNVGAGFASNTCKRRHLSEAARWPGPSNCDFAGEGEHNPGCWVERDRRPQAGAHVCEEGLSERACQWCSDEMMGRMVYEWVVELLSAWVAVWAG
eukprot:6181785-Pleurochrysis_carterae.AAC.1